MENLLLIEGLKKLYIRQECVQMMKKNQSYQGSLAQCAGLYGVVTINKLFQEQYVTPLIS